MSQLRYDVQFDININIKTTLNIIQLKFKKEYCLLNEYFLVKLLPLKLSGTLMKVFFNLFSLLANLIVFIERA